MGMYKALYRTWRPRTFEDVVGQDHITTTLKNEVKNGRVAHSYLFTGARGTGKTTCSKILAKAVNCLNPMDGDPCGECVICVGIENGSVTDTVEIDAASNNGVDDIRELREEALFAPASARYRVYIVDEAHMLSKGAFNALLKIMEEPPEHVLFILATTEVHKVPATILSRCQRFDFVRVSPADIAGRLRHIAEHEDFSLEEDAALLIGTLADGGIRDAISLMDQCASLTSAIGAQTVRDVAGLADRKHVLDLVDRILEENCEEVLIAVHELYRHSIDLRRLAENLVGRFRDLMLVKSVKNPVGAGLLICPQEELEQMQAQAKRATLSYILYAIDVLQELHRRLGAGGDSGGRAIFEMAMIRLTMPELNNSNAALAQRLERLEQAAASGKPPGRSKNKSAKTAENGPKAPEPVMDHSFKEEPAAPAETLTVDGQLVGWDKVLKLLEKSNPPLLATLEGSSAYIKGDLLLIDAPNTVFLDLMRASDATKESLRKATQEVTGRMFRLGPVKKSVQIEEQSKRRPIDILKETAAQNGIPVEEK